VLLQVLRLEDYGALLSIFDGSGKASGVQGLLHKSELSWDLVMAVEDIVKAGEGVEMIQSLSVPAVSVQCRVCYHARAHRSSHVALQARCNMMFLSKAAALLHVTFPQSRMLYTTPCSCPDARFAAAAAAGAGQELDVKVVSVDISRCRVSLSLKQMQRDPLQTTLDSIQWGETTLALPEVKQIIQVCRSTPQKRGIMCCSTL
jgi:predicted RNA-binding protein with RPS1 domain